MAFKQTDSIAGWSSRRIRLGGTGVCVKHFPHQLVWWTIKRQPPGEKLVENDAQTVDIGGRTDVARISADLFGGHVSRCTKDDPLLGGQCVDCLVSPRETEIDDDRRPIRCHHDIGGLEIAVDDARTVSDRHAASDHGHEPRRRVGTSGTAAARCGSPGSRRRSEAS